MVLKPKKKNIDWEDLIDSDDDDKPKSRTARAPAPKQPTTTTITAPAATTRRTAPPPASNAPAIRANAISAWQNFHVQAQARQEAETAHLPSDYPVPSETSSTSGNSRPAGSLHRQGSSYRPERFDALIRRAQNQAPARSKVKVRPRVLGSSGTSAKRVVRFTGANRTVVSKARFAPPPSRPRPVGPASNLFSVLATSAQLAAQQRQMSAPQERPAPPTPQPAYASPATAPYGSPQPSVNKLATPRPPSTPARISFGLATSAELAAYMQGKPKPADTTTMANPPPSRSLAESIHAPKASESNYAPKASNSIHAPKPSQPSPSNASPSIYAPKPSNPPPVSNATSVSDKERREREIELENERSKYATMVKDFEQKFQLAESDTATLRREKERAEERAAKALADLAEAKKLHLEYRKRTEEHAKQMQEEWEKKVEEWKNRERAWQARQTEWQQAIALSCRGSTSSDANPTSAATPASATNTTRAATPPSASTVASQQEVVWIPPFPASFDRGPVLFKCRLKVDAKKPADAVEVHRNDDVSELVRMFAAARGLGTQVVEMIKQQINVKRGEYFQKEAEEKEKKKENGWLSR